MSLYSSFFAVRIRALNLLEHLLTRDSRIRGYLFENDAPKAMCYEENRASFLEKISESLTTHGNS
jgi:CHASE3 domain sensor protein